MERIAGYNSMVEAGAAAAFLIAAGVPAKVFGGNDPFAGAARSPSAGGRFGVFVDSSEAARAAGLLREFHAEPAVPEAGWEHFTVPDLSCLPEGTEALCPSCGEPLPLDAGLTECPSCGAEVDVGEVLVARYGPDILADCYPEEVDPADVEVLTASAVSCDCGYTLAGLPPTGACPECGQRYSKREIIRRGLR